MTTLHLKTEHTFCSKAISHLEQSSHNESLPPNVDPNNTAGFSSGHCSGQTTQNPNPFPNNWLRSVVQVQDV